jgi:hypothetical protein
VAEFGDLAVDEALDVAVELGSTDRCGEGPYSGKAGDADLSRVVGEADAGGAGDRGSVAVEQGVRLTVGW